MVQAPKVIDLYSGVGGLSLGAIKAGFSLIGAVEADQRIIATHAVNFPNSIHLCSDVSKLMSKNLRTDVKLGNKDLAGLIGGPPCQGFSSIGKRSISDDRNNQFINFYKLVKQLQPSFYLVENVPGILDEPFNALRKKADKYVENDYKILPPFKISANEFGAATTRTRVFFIGVRNDVKGSEKISIEIEKLKHSDTKVKDALLGLPIKISENWIDYLSSWQKVKPELFNKYVHSLNRMIDGVGNSQAIKRFKKEKVVSGCFATIHSEDVIERYLNLRPGQQDRISKSTRLKRDGLCPTLRAGTDNTRGSFQAVRPIHHTQPRVITPREAARLQGFPDWFQFHETKWHSFRQIGNSVCPIVGEKVLKAIKLSLNM